MILAESVPVRLVSLLQKGALPVTIAGAKLSTENVVLAGSVGLVHGLTFRRVRRRNEHEEE